MPAPPHRVGTVRIGTEFGQSAPHDRPRTRATFQQRPRFLPVSSGRQPIRPVNLPLPTGSSFACGDKREDTRWPWQNKRSRWRSPGNPGGVILHNQDWQTLELRWLPVEMSDADFKETLGLLAEMGEQHKPRFMIIDATDFHHEFGPGGMQWRDENIIPRYGAAGVTKFAFLVSAGFPGTVESGARPGVEG